MFFKWFLQNICLPSCKSTNYLSLGQLKYSVFLKNLYKTIKNNN